MQGFSSDTALRGNCFGSPLARETCWRAALRSDVRLGAGLIGKQHLGTELGQLVLSEKPGRTSTEEVTLFKSVGVAVQDLCAAA